MVPGLGAKLISVLKDMDLEGLGSGIGAALAGGGNNSDTPSPPSDGVDTGATRVLPGKELILPVAADSDEAADIFSRSLSGLDRDTFNRLEDIKAQTALETGTTREKAYRAAQLRSNIARDRALSMPTRTAMEDVNQFRNSSPGFGGRSPGFPDQPVGLYNGMQSSGFGSDLDQSRNDAKATWRDAANIAAARKEAVYGDDPFEQDYIPKDTYRTKTWVAPEWSKFPKGLSGLPQVGSEEWNKKPEVETSIDTDPVTPDVPDVPDPVTTPFIPTLQDSSYPWIRDEAGDRVQRNPYYNPFHDSDEEVSRWNPDIPNPNVPGGFGKWEWGYGSDPFNDQYSTSMDRLKGALNL